MLFFECRIHNAAPDQAAALMEKHIDYCWKKLPIGMSKQEALAFLPRSQNTNTENVCVALRSVARSMGYPG